MSRVGRSHHVLGVEHLLSEFGYRDRSVACGSPCRERSETDHEEVETREGNHVDCEFTQVRVELTRESEAGGYTRHDEGDEVVEVTVSWGSELEGTETNVVEGLVVDTEGLVRVLDELVDGESGVVGLDDGVGDLSSLSCMHFRSRRSSPWARGQPKRYTSSCRDTLP